MTDFFDWLNQPFTWLEEDERQFDIQVLVRRRAFSVVLLRGTTKMAAQTVALAHMDNATEGDGPTAQPGHLTCQLIGYRGYPGQTDFDVQRGDQFFVGGTTWRVTYVDDMITGRRTAHAESVQGNVR